MWQSRFPLPAQSRAEQESHYWIQMVKSRICCWGGNRVARAEARPDGVTNAHGGGAFPGIGERRCAQIQQMVPPILSFGH